MLDANAAIAPVHQLCTALNVPAPALPEVTSDHQLITLTQKP